jgi:hypothetical protein
MRKSRITSIIPILSFLFIIGGCSTTKAPDMFKTFEISEFKKPIGSFLVIGSGEDEQANKKFEKLLKDALLKENVRAISARESIAKGERLTKESAIALVDKLNVESVIVTRLLGTRLDIEKTEKRTEVKIQRPQFESLTDFFVYEYTDVQVEQDFDVTATAVLATDLFLVANSGRVLSMQSTSFDKKSADAIIEETVEEVVAQLKRDNVL